MERARWISIEDLCSELGLPPSIGTEEVRSFVKARLKDLNTTSHGGNFDDPHAKEEFYKFVEALEYLEKVKLVPVQEYPTPPVLYRNLALVNADALVTAARKDIKRRYVLPKITSGTVSLIIAFLFALPGRTGSSIDSLAFRWAGGNEAEAQTIIDVYQVEDRERRLARELVSVKPLPVSEMMTEINRLAYPSETDDITVRRAFSELRANQSVLESLSSMNVDSTFQTSRVNEEVIDGLTRLGESITNLERDNAIRMRPVMETKLLIKHDVAVFMGAVCLFFLILWVREKSDEQWIEVVGREDSLVEIVHKLRLSIAKSGGPQRFSLTDVSRIVGRKRVPRGLG